MKKLLLLLMVVVGIVGCDKKEEIPPKTIISGWNYAEELAKKYGIDIKKTEILGGAENNKKNETYFIGIKNNKLWIVDYEITSKKERKSFISIKDFSKTIRYDKPYVGNVVDTISHFKFNEYCGLVSENDNSVYSVGCQTKHRYFYTLLFCKEGIINKSCIHTNNIYIKKWYNNTILSNIPNEIICYSMDGDLLYNITYDYKFFRYKSSIPLNNIYECITWFDDALTFTRINLKTLKEYWKIKLDLNIPKTAKYDLTKSELVGTDTVKAIYDITLYDGTKSTKIVNIDVNSGEYTVN